LQEPFDAAHPVFSGVLAAILYQLFSISSGGTKGRPACACIEHASGRLI
jgi:hypothetical protein